MRKVIDFLHSWGHWILLAFIEVVAFALIFNGSLYHRFLNVAFSNCVVGAIQQVAGEISSYIGLREKNRQLSESNALLEMQYLQLKQQMEFAMADTITPLTFVPDSTEAIPQLQFLTARVISSTINRGHNLIIINRGSESGVKKDMGVMSARGVVGIVSSVSQGYSVVIPLINPSLNLSCKLLHTKHFGSLAWDTPGDLSSRLTDLPSHVQIHAGDTLVTSGYSSVFPPNLYVGRVDSTYHVRDGVVLGNDNIPVTLGVDFSTLDFVYVVLSGVSISHETLDSLQAVYN
ncbi:MAG: rod shape-determining protein MreC [Bacteroidales bacterium]|nr:rod shape-determining protein MreC [Porphyromonas sp.]MDD6933996.1 rod shape-determining protein MreC [Bacteroidales bacterium]MDY3101533.1 rod shape-determining protein MreC [Porphyromonas sp.]